MLEDRVAAASRLALKAVVVDVEPYAAEAALNKFVLNCRAVRSISVLRWLDVGAECDERECAAAWSIGLYARQQIGGAQLTQQIQGAFGLSAEEAESAKRNGGPAGKFMK